MLDLSKSFTSSATQESRYCETGINTDLSFFTLEEEVKVLRRQNQDLKQTVIKLEEELAQVRWGMKKIAGNDHKVKFYTGLPNYQVLVAFLAYLKQSSDAVVNTEAQTWQT